MKEIEAIPERYLAIVTELISRNGSGPDFFVRKALGGGNTDALVLVVDVGQKAPNSNAEYPSGEYILKLDTKRVWNVPEPAEGERHEAATTWNTEFSSRHIPRLIDHAEDDKSQALLYEIAGQSLVNLITADSLDAGALRVRYPQICLAIRKQWNQKYERAEMRATDLLKDWLGYRLEAPSLHEFVSDQLGTGPLFYENEAFFVNPLWFCEFIGIERPATFFKGMIHGDLHPGNITLERSAPRSEKFWLIDFALSRQSGLGYDESYLEIAFLLKHLQGAGPERLIGILDALDAPVGDPKATMIPVQDIGLLDCLREMRLADDRWQSTSEPNRRDRCLAQQMLAKVAVSINWCNKPIEPSMRRMALVYGAHAARTYVRTFHEQEWHKVINEVGRKLTTRVADADNDGVEQAKRSEWNALWEQLCKFDATRAKFVLITDRVRQGPDTSSLGMIPWTAVIDLDPESDSTGLFSCAGALLGKTRSVKQFGIQPLAVDFDRGTAWLMAGGWPSRHEPVPDSLRSWRQIYPERVRELASDIRNAVSTYPIKVVLLHHEDHSNDALIRILESVDEKFGDAAEIISLGATVQVDASVAIAQSPVTPEQFVSNLRRMYGVVDDAPIPKLPTADGMAAIPIEQLRNLEEDLEVLHSQVLSDETGKEIPQNSFWRGNPPSWIDLHSNLDVIRDVHSHLVLALESALGQSRNHTVELHHSPGAGGTTAALRIAWTFRARYTTAILRRFSRMTVDRVDQLFQLSQRPVLLIAEASELPPSAREELYHGLAARNSRVVILYVVRTFQKDPDRALDLFDPMNDSDAGLFLGRYSVLTNSAHRQRQLKKITEATDPVWRRLRSPFFYGLTTFEREFESIDRYVGAHLENISHRVRQVILYLALTTRYSQLGLDESLVTSLFDLHAGKELDIVSVFGEAPAHLIVRRGKTLRLLHPLIAEEVLKELLGGTSDDAWRYGLKDLSTDFIHDVVRLLGGDSVETNRLFVQLFILRDTWYEGRARGRPRFAELINAIPTASGQSQILELLAAECPNEAHYWNHLGRHHFYEGDKDFRRAEQYLTTAVELSPDDPYHHHSLGMVRRFWIEKKLNDLFSGEQLPDEERVLDEVKDLYAQASENFSKARSLNPDDPHGYITHTQLLLYIAERLLRASNTGLGPLTKKPSIVGDWLKSNVILAEELLSHVRHDRGEGNPSNYELRCENQLSGVYGDYEAVIQDWEGMLSQGGAQEELRRALALAYWARGNRVWSGLPDEELRRIVSMMEANLRKDPTNERDIRTWFQAYHRLPEFSRMEALDRLGAWASRSDALDAHYYLYILHFLRFRDEPESSEDSIRSHLDKCRELARGRRTHSYEWLARDPVWCPLVNHTELGTWEKGASFYPKTELLAEVTGTIESIKGPQAGTIKLGKVLRAFFVPSTHQWMSKDVNAVVHFYLGFSYEGLRAWSVRPGPAMTAVRPSAQKASIDPKPAVSTLAKMSGALQPEQIAKLASLVDEPGETKTESMRTAVLQMLDETDERGGELHIAAIGERLTQKFGKGAAKYGNFSNLGGFLGSIPEIVIIGQAPRLLVRRRISPALGEQVSLREDVRKQIVEWSRDRQRLGRQPLLSALGWHLNKTFGHAVYKRLGFQRLSDLLLSYDGISLEDSAQEQVVTMADKQSPPPARKPH